MKGGTTSGLTVQRSGEPCLPRRGRRRRQEYLDDGAVSECGWPGCRGRITSGLPAGDREVLCEEINVVAATIDAQLTAALSEENGFRQSDVELREMLLERQGSRNWVASAAGLLAVPVRGRLLAEHLSPTVGTVIETHPRASLLFALGEEFLEPVWEYKPKRDDTRSETEVRRSHVRTLWKLWSEAFGVLPHEPVYHDGALDSLVCATVAHLYHHAPAALHKLRHGVAGKVGRGPFYVVAPDAEPRARGA